MRIASSNVLMQGSSEKITSIKASSGVVKSIKGLGNITNMATNFTFNGSQPEVPRSMSINRVKELIDENKARAASQMAKISSKSSSDDEGKDFRLILLEKMMMALTGRKFRFFGVSPIKLSGTPTPTPTEATPDSTQRKPLTDELQEGDSMAMTMAVAQGRVSYSSIEIYERQTMTFSTQAIVNTADGKTINIDIDMIMSQEAYTNFTSLNVQAGKLCDPLVINFGRSSAELTDTKMTFDLDCDGTADQISTLASGSGFLALDLNGDGIINDGSELFGAKSGNGFEDLAKYDSDGNGWIDENDKIFDKLRIWYTDSSGESQLVGLGEMGIGAVYLGNVSTNYELSGNEGMNGVIRRTGFFLKETGEAGTVQHVDLAI